MSKRQQTDGSLAVQEKNVIVIEAAKRPEAEKLRVAAYCRVSSDSSDQMNSFMAQLNYYTALISGKDTWMLVDLYADAGISGTSAEKRPDFQRLLSDCRRGQIDKILVKSISRFARNTKDCLETVRTLKAIGVGVYFEEQNIDTSNMSGELLTAVFSALAQKESESISANLRWGYQFRMRNGTCVQSSVPFGYELQDGKMVINREQAGIVQSIFNDYLAGRSVDDIVARLNRGNTAKHCSRVWNRNAVTYILSNERYIGDRLWQKTYTTDTLPFRQVRNHGERQQYYVESTHAPIIEKETFLAAQRLRKDRCGTYSPQGSRHDVPPLRRMIFCGVCGTPFRRKICRGVVYWTCHNHDNQKKNCPVSQIPEEEIHAAFLRLYHKLRLHGGPILKQMLSDLQSVRERRMLWSQDIIELNKRISEITDQDRMLADMNKHGLVDPDIFISQSNALAQQLRAAKQEKDRLLGIKEDDTIPKTRELLENLEAMPEFLPDFDGELFIDLVDRITAEDGNTLRFRLKNGLELRETIERRMR